MTDPIDTADRTADPTQVKRIANGFCHAQLLMAGSELGVFADLEHNGASTVDDITTRLRIHPRGCRDLLHGLVLLGLLEHDDGRYRNHPLTSTTLIPGGAEYIGGFLRRADHMLYPAWGRLTAALRTGEPQTSGAGPDAFCAMLEDAAQREQYLRMMDSANSLIADPLAVAFDWEEHHEVLDVGGCRGNLVARLIQRHPHLRATVFDLPPMRTSLAEHMAALGVSDQVSFVAGDFHTDPLPTADVIILGHVLHNWSPDERALLVNRAFRAVRPGGALLVYDAMLTEQPSDLARILVSLNMLLVTEGGSEYTVPESERWFAAAGCTDVSAQPLGSTDTLMVGRKPADTAIVDAPLADEPRPVV